MIISPANTEESKESSPTLTQEKQVSFNQLRLDLSKTPIALLTTFSFLPGNVIYHKIARLDKKIRNLLI